MAAIVRSGSDVSRMAGTRENALLNGVGRVFLYIILVSGALVMIMPLVWMISTASKPVEETNLPEFFLFPSRFQLFENFQSAFRRVPLARYFFNSLFVTSSATLSELLLASMAGYSFARFNYPGKNLLFTFVLATLMIPFYVVVVPLYVVVHRLGLLDTYWAMILPFMVGAFGIFLMRQFMLTVPQELTDAARIDGAGEFTIYSRIVLPLCVPALCTLAIFSFLAHWDSFVWPLLVVHQRDMYTVPLGLTYFQSEYIAYSNEQMAASLLALVPTFAMVFGFQRYYVQGVVMSGIKG
jgi:ABC-type glycerol-3-phosphate transport system permease component